MQEHKGQLPTESDKLAYKFIYDTLKDETPSVEDPELTPSTTEPPTTTTTSEAPQFSPPPLPEGKKYFRIGESSKVIGVEAHVLRYWESEFPEIRPQKSRSGQRVYTRRDVEYFQLIKHLLYIEKYSVKGAKKQLREKKKTKATTAATQPPAPGTASIETTQKQLKILAQEVKELISIAKKTPIS